MSRGRASGARGKPFPAALIAALGASLAGCAGYHVGPVNGEPAGARSVQIAPFQNRTSEPRVIDAVSTAVRRIVQEDGTYRLDTHGDGDIQVTGVITKFDRGALAYQPKDTLTVQDFTLTMTAHVTAVERSSGKTNLDTVVFGQTVIRVGADQTSAERQAIPLIADDLARNLVDLLTEGPW